MQIRGHRDKFALKLKVSPHLSTFISCHWARGEVSDELKIKLQTTVE